MTSRPVTQMNSFYRNVASSKNSNEVVSNGGKFTQIMSNTAGKSDMKMSSVQPESSTTKATQTKTVVEKKVAEKPENAKSDVSKENAAKVGNSSETKEATAVEETVKEVTDKIKEEIETELGVSEEELVRAMEALGLGMTDLMNPENIVALAVELTGSEDTTALLTNESLYTSVKDVLKTVGELTSELLDQLNMTPEEFEAKLIQLSETPKAVTENMELDSSEELRNSEMNASTQKKQEVAEVPQIVINDETKGTTAKDKNQQTEPGTLEVDTKDASEGMKEANVQNENAQDDEKSGNQNQENNQGAVSFKEMMSGNTGKADMVAKAMTAVVDTQEIIKQITNQIKITFQTETTKMEMELNPASLGKVGLQIESKGGVVTAQFTAQNETVKAAIESQITELKENLISQGVKIESVEVTVESHAFEKNMEQNSGNAQEENGQNNKGRKRTSLNLMSETDEELSVEDALVRDMMIQDGNSVNYTA